MAQSSYTSNFVLASLPAADIDMLLPHLRIVDLPQETVLFEPGGTVGNVVFPHAGIVSLVVNLATGEMIECAMVGRESLVGGLAALDSNISISRAVMQVAGCASMVELEQTRRLAERSEKFRRMLVRHEQLLLAQCQQSAACNAVHPLEARLSRWLLRCRDLSASDDLALTQEFVAEMLGVRRTSVSIVANTLQRAGFIKYRRGHIRVLDATGLKESSCECYEAVKMMSDRLIGPAPVF
ncbi:MAG TPA: Crp/Fnr family transcriptional regulator [Xanthobacteraceae bacterium]|jgi:CRP-like cAMP-binding protein